VSGTIEYKPIVLVNCLIGAEVFEYDNCC